MRNAKKIALFFGDILFLYVSLAITLLIRYPLDQFSVQYAVHAAPFSLLFAIWVLVFYLGDLYKLSSFRANLQIARLILKSVIVAGIVSVISLYLFSNVFELTPKTNLLLAAGLFGIFSYFTRVTAVRLFTSGALRLLALGASPIAEEIFSFIEKNPQAGYRVARKIQNTNQIASPREISTIIEREGINIILADPSLFTNKKTAASIYKLLPFEVKILSFTDFYEEIFEKTPIDYIDYSWFAFHVSTRRPLYDLVKRAIDLAASFTLAMALAPLAVLIAVLIKVTSKGPIIYAQTRMGKNGNPFILFKFRTMRSDKSGALWTTKDDSRITPIGKILRYSHLDEIPQLFNILRGDISFTGPRPERIELAEQYQEKFLYYEMRHAVKPGLTGWAQINFRPSASFEEAFEKLKYDIYYVKNRSFLLDLAILIRTIRYVFTSHN